MTPETGDAVQQRACACGCGLPADPRSKYHGDHFRILAESRRKIRECKKYATRRNLSFDLELSDVRRLIETCWPDAESTAIRRVDKTRGFEPGNVYLKERRRPKWESDASKIRGRLARFLTPRHEGLTIEDVERAWREQGGACLASGRRLVLVGKHKDRDALALDRPDPTSPWGPQNLRLLARSVQSMFDKWGETYVLKVAEGIVLGRKRKKDKKEGAD